MKFNTLYDLVSFWGSIASLIAFLIYLFNILREFSKNLKINKQEFKTECEKAQSEIDALLTKLKSKELSSSKKLQLTQYLTIYINYTNDFNSRIRGILFYEYFLTLSIFAVGSLLKHWKFLHYNIYGIDFYFGTILTFSLGFYYIYELINSFNFYRKITAVYLIDKRSILNFVIKELTF